MRKIILLGYMGCGKSTVARTLSRIVNIPFVDLDKFIENKAGMSINSIFEKRGEIYFRKLEHNALVELLSKEEPLIIGLGGGTPCYANNHELLKGEHVNSIYLRASIDTLFKRLSANKDKRPLIANKSAEEMREFIAIHLFERSYFYNQAKQIVIVDGKTIDQVAMEIASTLA